MASETEDCSIYPCISIHPSGPLGIKCLRLHYDVPLAYPVGYKNLILNILA